MQRYFKTAQIQIIHPIWKSSSKVHVPAKMDTDKMAEAANYYNFSSYSILAACVYAICMINHSFHQTPIQKITLIAAVSQH